MLALGPLQYEIFQKRYARDETKWGQLAKRVSTAVASVEVNGAVAEWQKKFERAIAAGDFMPGGRILFGAGRPKFNMLNCYRLHPEDTCGSIGKTIRDTYLISCGGGGIGYNFSSIRPLGDLIQDIKYSAPGAVSNMRMINAVGDHVRSGKNRRTALIGILNVDHPDLLDFLHVKLDLGELNNFNISIGITNDFIEAVRKDKPWTFSFNGREYKVFEIPVWQEVVGGEPYVKRTERMTAFDVEDAMGRVRAHLMLNQGESYGEIQEVTLMAKEIWDLLMKNSWASGDPGIYNLDLANSYTNVSYFEDLDSPNPCGEIPLPAYGNCCLGHVNLNHMYDEERGDVNWSKLARTVRTGIRFLDNVLSANHYPVEECRTVGERSRRIGLGVTGLHYLLIKLGHTYGSEECIEFLDRLFATFRNEAYKASVSLAREKGSFPAFDADKYSKELFFQQLPTRIQKDIQRHGIRNAVMLTIAPCGTNSMVLGVSSGIEPMYSPVYKRRFRDGNNWREEVVVDPLLAEYYRAGRDVTHFRGAHDVTVREHISVQATIQKYIDSSISKTTNLPTDYRVEDLGEVILEYADCVKGFTIYRSGSKGQEPLEAVDVRDPAALEAAMAAAGSEAPETLEACRDGSCEL